jgi:hypothetical protein
VKFDEEPWRSYNVYVPQGMTLQAVWNKISMIYFYVNEALNERP